MTKVPLPDGFEMLQTPGVTAAVRSSEKALLLDLGILDPTRLDELRQSGRAIGSGRGGAVSVAIGPEKGGRAVIRHCRRGGPLGTLLGDRYFSGARPLEELAVSEAARSAGVPVPECLAAVIRRSGIFCRCDFILREVPEAVTLEEWLRGNVDADAVRTVTELLAAAFARLVAAGIYHADFHAGNVLVQQGEGGFRITLIDFDKAEQRDPLPATLRDRMLFRFNRGLVKRGLAPRPVGSTLRLRFCRQAGIAATPEDAREFAASCAAHLRRHSWRY